MGAIIAVDFNLRRRMSARPRLESVQFREPDLSLLPPLGNAMLIYIRMLIWWGTWLPEPPDRPGT